MLVVMTGAEFHASIQYINWIGTFPIIIITRVL